MKFIEIGTGYTPIPARIGAATEIIVEELVGAFKRKNRDIQLIDIKTNDRKANDLPIKEVSIPSFLNTTDTELGVLHKLKRVIYSIALSLKLKNILKNTEEPMMLHFHNQYNLFFFLNLVKAKYRSKAKIAYTVHSYVWGEEWKKIKNVIKKKYFQEVYCVKKADCVFVLNDKTREHFIAHLGVNADKIHQIVNGVNTDKYCILKNEVVDEFKIRNDLKGRKIILQVGSVCDRKNQLGVIQQMYPFLCENREVLYAYAGGIIDDEYQKSINEYVSTHNIENQVRYLGEVEPGEQLNLYYNAADVVVFPSKIEAFGLVIIEAIAAGTPVLLMEEPYFNLERGYSIYRDEKQLLCRLEEHIKNPINMNAARDCVVNNYGWDRVAELHLQIWNEA